jgi:hypothetical protein
MNRRYWTVLCAAAALTLVIPAAAWAKPNFSGSWKLNAGKSDFGQMTGPAKMERKVTHEDPSLKYSIVQSSPQGTDVTTDLAYTTDGKPSTNQTPMGELTGTASFDGDVLNIVNKREFQGLEITQTERWTLSDEGKTLTIDSRVSMPRGHVEMKIVMDKQ